MALILNQAGTGGRVEHHIYTAVFVLSFLTFCILVLGKSRQVKTGQDFSLADRSLTATQVSWVIIGTLVGGVSTIGTVQTAYDQGVAAWVFTLGSGISCFVLGCFFAAALRREQVATVSEFLGRYFGERFRYYTSFFNSLGMFIHIIAQYLAAMAILESVFGFSRGASVGVTTLLMAVFVLSGGIAGAGAVGKIKFFMLYGIMILSAGLALYRGDGISNILDGLPAGGEFLNFFSSGVTPTLVDLGSMISGVLSTQIYLQAIFSAQTVKQARNGAFLSAVVIPPIGILGIIIGLYLRANFPELEGGSAQALPFFFKLALPPAVAAFCSAGLLLAVLGTGSGLVLGVATNLYMDGLQTIRGKDLDHSLAVARFCALGVLISSAAFVFTGFDRAILQWSYLSMGLRGAAVFAGLFTAVFMGRCHGTKGVRPILYFLPLAYIGIELIG